MYSIIPPGPPLFIASYPCLLYMVPSRVVAGFPSQADDERASRFDLSKQLVIHPQVTYVQRVSGNSMEADGIFHDDILVIDKAIRPRHNMVVGAVVDGAFTVKRLYDQRGRVKLRAANPTYPDIVPKEGQTLEIWGVRHELHQAVPTCVIPPPSYPTPNRTGPGGG